MRKRTFHRVVARLGCVLFLAGCGDDSSSDVPDARVGQPDAAPSAPDAGPVASCVPTALPGPLSEGAWDPRFTIAGFTGQDGLTPKVFDLAKDAGGDILAAGYFRWLGRDRVEPLLRFHEGHWAPARASWEIKPPPAGFSSVAVDAGGRLALATYDSFGARNGEIWVDSGTGLEVIGRFEGLVKTLAWYEGDLWVGGDFLLQESPVPGLARWDDQAWSGPPGGNVDGPAYELKLDGDSLFVGGAFTKVGGIDAAKVAEWNGKAWIAYDLPFFGAGVYGIERGPDGALYAGGAFHGSVEPGALPGGLARWSGTAWEIVGNGLSNPFFPGVVSDLAVLGEDIYVAGCFSHVNGTPESPGAIPARSLARWTGTEWEALDDGTAGVATLWFEQSACGDEGPDAIWDAQYQRWIDDGTRLFLAGSLSGVGTVASQSIIAYDGESWVPQGAPDLGIAGSASALAVGGPDCALYAFGGFSALTNAGSVRVPSRLVRYQDGWTALGDKLPSGLFCSQLAVNGAGDVYLACFDDQSGAAKVLRLDGSSWVPVGDPLTLEPPQDLKFDPAGKLWIAGGGATGYVARLDGDHFTVVEDGFDGLVYRLDFGPAAPNPAETPFVVGGAFTHVGGTAANRVARRDGAEWAALGDGLTNLPVAVEYGATGIYAATTDEGNPGRLVLGKWDGAQWVELGDPAHGLPAPMGESTHTFTSLLEIGTNLVAVGYVWPETGGRNVFLFDGASFTAIGGGAAAISVDAVAFTHGALWFGGSIAEVGSGAGLLPSVGIARYAWP